MEVHTGPLMVRSEAGPRQAIALQYNSDLPAPLLLASGRGRAAASMVGMAEKAGVPVVRDVMVATMLAPLDIGSLVPPEYWEIVAKVFVFVREAVR
jgi:type III secretion system FlhB-like substrate exporter